MGMEKSKGGGAEPVMRFNHLAAAEMGAEQNFNAIDGIINNEKKPSILEQLRQNRPKPPDEHEHGGKIDRAAEAAI